jgi:hypothetical protein
MFDMTDITVILVKLTDWGQVEVFLAVRMSDYSRGTNIIGLPATDS